MGSLVAVVFYLALAFNVYYAAKRAGRWSWPQFFVVVAALVVVPVLLVQLLMRWSWLQDKPVLFTLIDVGLIMLFVCAMAFALKKFWPLPAKPKS
jgi:hypothetical protein